MRYTVTFELIAPDAMPPAELLKLTAHAMAAGLAQHNALLRPENCVTLRTPITIGDAGPYRPYTQCPNPKPCPYDTNNDGDCAKCTRKR